MKIIKMKLYSDHIEKIEFEPIESQQEPTPPPASELEELAEKCVETLERDGCLLDDLDTDEVKSIIIETFRPLQQERDTLAARVKERADELTVERDALRGGLKAEQTVCNSTFVNQERIISELKSDLRIMDKSNLELSQQKTKLAAELATEKARVKSYSKIFNKNCKNMIAMEKDIATARAEKVVWCRADLVESVKNKEGFESLYRGNWYTYLPFPPAQPVPDKSKEDSAHELSKTYTQMNKE